MPKHNSKSGTIASVLRIHPRFMRSVNLERDVADPNSSRGYLLTPTAEAALARITDSCANKSTQRAWRITGDYGAGKSDFGLAMSRILSGKSKELPRELKRFVGSTRLQPMLATGNSEPLATTVLRALGTGSGNSRTGASGVMQKVEAAVSSSKRRGFDGILLVIDELGKNLEHASRNAQEDDIFLLQQLAEAASRSGNRPFVFVVMLHQGVAAYASNLDSSARREWEKVAGRFEEILFTQPIEQVTHLIGASLNVIQNNIPRDIQSMSCRDMSAAVKLGLYGGSATRALADLGPALYPLHPTVVPMLVRMMRRFGQNERSLFSFISSSEPMGLQTHASKRMEEAGHFRLPHLFDYLRQNILPSIGGGSHHTHWGLVEAVLAATDTRNAVEEDVLKSVALLSLLDAPDLPATEGVLCCALNHSASKVNSAIERLRSNGTIYERGSVRGFCLWPHTSVDLDAAFSKGIEASFTEAEGIRFLCDKLAQKLVPRGYYVRVGTLRYASLEFIPADQLPALLENPPSITGRDADLHLRVVLPTSERERKVSMSTLRKFETPLPTGLIVGVAVPQDGAMGALRDLKAWNWVKQNTPALSGDRFAREEVSRQIAQSERQLHDQLAGLDNLSVSTGGRMPWFAFDSEHQLTHGRELLSFLGDKCEEIYPDSPYVQNELINRRVPSSAAVAARTKLVQAMADAPEQLNLGMDDTKRPAEMALYMTVVKAGGFHAQAKGGNWKFRLPTVVKDTQGLLPALNGITALLKGKGTDALVPMPAIFELLALPPFGIRDGLQPFVVAIYLAVMHQRVAMYEDETYLHSVGGSEFLRLMKEPQFFHLQYCGIEGVRAEHLNQMLHLLEIAPRDAENSDVVDLIRPLVVFISREIPDYSRSTKSISAKAVAVRQALMSAREPVRLVFTELPNACGLEPVTKRQGADAEQLAAELKKAIHEIRSAYPKLLDRLGKAICAAFDVAGGLAKGRQPIADRASQLSAAITEPSLRAFALRLSDLALEDRAWIESVANLLSRKSPERWSDGDEQEFHHQLENFSSRFRRVEMATIGTTQKLNGHACRIALTRSDGTEVGDLVNWEQLDEQQIGPAQTAIADVLRAHGRHGLAGALRAIWSELEKEEKT